MLYITIDWLAGTFHKERSNEAEFINKYARALPILSGTPRHGYNQAEIDRHGVQLLWNSDREEMGTHVVFPGSALKSLYEQQNVQLATLLRDFANAGAKISRLDLAKDFTGAEIDLETIYQSLERGRNEGTARSFSKVQSAGGGYTLYVGSRQSEKFIRIYNKAAQESLTDTYWYRYELETKGMVARAVATSLIASGNWSGVFDVATRGMLDFFGTTPLAHFYALDTVPVGLPKIERQTDREAWIASQVLPAVAKYYIDNPQSEAIARLIATLNLIDKQRKL